MLWDASALRGYAIVGSDGHLGAVSDFLFEDTIWKMRWLVVDAGHWRPGREVLLPISVLGQPDEVERQFPVSLTTRQVKESPDINADLPVSRRMELSLYDHYGWDPYWNSIGASAIDPRFAPALDGASEKLRDSDAAGVPMKDGDPHLRSIGAITGHHVHATDGEIGHVEDFLIEDAGWDIRYIEINTKSWWPGNKVLISPRSIREIDWAGKFVRLDVDRQRVRNSPPYDPSITVDGAYEETFLTYYGIRWVQP